MIIEKEMTMDNNFEKAFYKKMNDKRHRVVLSIASSIFRSVLILIPTLLLRNIYNALELGLDAMGVIVAIILTFVLPIIVAASYSLDIRLSKYIFIIIKDIRVQAISNIVGMRLRAILSQNKSNLFNRIIVALEELGEYYYYSLNNSTWYITTSVVGIGLMLLINYRITIVLLIFVLFQIGCSLIIQKRIERVKEQENQLQAKGCDYIIRIMTYNSFIKTALLDNSEIENEKGWERDSWKTSKLKIQNGQIIAFLSFVLTLMRTLYLFFAAHYLFLNNSMLKGDFIALNSYIAWLTPVFLGLQECIEDIISARANKRRVNECLEEEVLENKQKTIVPNSPLSRMEVSHLAFKYKGANKELFSDISFKMQSGEALFIVGASGSGKSTLLNIMMNLEPNYVGQIIYNECNLQLIDDTWLHQNVVMVGQDVELLPTTLRKNILYSGVEVEDIEVIQILQSLKIGYLLDMPGALDWDMKAIPRLLSDGEKKRISIARAILSKPQALFLDEPTAGLDNINKMDVIRFIEQSVDGMLVIVTHDSVFTDHARVLYMS